MTAKFFQFGQLLSAKRLAAGLPQQSDLAERMNVSQQTVSRWEQGTSRPKQLDMKPLAAALNLVNYDDLLEAAGYALEPVTPKAPANTRLFPVSALPSEDFERFTVSLFQAIYPEAEVSRVGKSGHDQAGIDVEIRFSQKKRFTAQCKRHAKFGPARVKDAIQDVEKPGTKNYIILSRIATPDARTAVADVGGDTWTMWDAEDISTEIRKLDMIHQKLLVDTYFPGRRPELLGMAEPGPWQEPDEFFAPFINRDSIFNHSWTLVGRETEVQAMLSGLQGPEKVVVFVRGSGGVGKTRILKETAERYRQANRKWLVLFAGNSVVQAKDLDALNQSNVLLVVDDAQNRTDIALLMHWVKSNRSRARLLLATRPYGFTSCMDMATKAGIGPELRTIVAVEPLKSAQASILAKEVLKGSDFGAEMANAIARYTYDCPLATVMGAYLVARNKIPPEAVGKEENFRQELVARFRDVLAGDIGALPTDPDLLKKILRVAALVQPFSTDTDEFKNLVRDAEGIAVDDCARLMKLLLDAGVFVRRGLEVRITPDLLGDFIIQEACNDGLKVTTSQVDKVVRVASEKQLEKLLVNVSRLDWRMSDTSEENSRLLDGVWGNLERMNLDGSFLAKAVAAAAYYQPEKALEFAENRIRAKDYSHDLARLLKNAAYNLDYVPRACACLWALGKNDDRETNREPLHPIRVLNELCAVVPNKPLEYNAAVIDFMLTLLSRADSWDGRYTPLDVLGGILASEGHYETVRGIQITMHNYVVNLDVVRTQRDRVTDAVLGLLRHPKASVAMKAADMMDGVLRYPMGRGNLLEKDDVRKPWEAEAKKNLEKIEAELKKGDLRPLVALELIKAGSWHAHYANDSTTKVAKRITKYMDDSLETRATIALLDPWNHSLFGEDPDHQADKAMTFVTTVAKELLSKFGSDIEGLRVFLEVRLQEIADARAQASPWHLVFNLMNDNVKFAAHMLDKAISLPDTRAAQFAGSALTVLLTKDDKVAAEKVDLLLSAKTPAALLAIAVGYGGEVRDPASAYSALDRKAMMATFTSNDDRVQALAVDSLNRIGKRDSKVAAELLAALDIGSKEKLPEVVFRAFAMTSKRAEEGGLPDILGEKDVVRLLKQLVPAVKIDGYWTEAFISAMSKRYPMETARFLRERVEYCMKQEYGFRVLGYEPFRHKKLQFKEAPHATELRVEMLEWVKAHSADRRFRREAGDLFAAMFGPITPELMRSLERLLDDSSREGLDTIRCILEHAGSRYVFDDADYVIRLIEQAARFGDDFADGLIGTFVSTVVQGAIVGTPGEPHPKYLKVLEDSKTILSWLSPLSPAYRLYKALERDAKEHIAWQAREKLQIQAEEEAADEEDGPIEVE